MMSPPTAPTRSSSWDLAATCAAFLGLGMLIASLTVFKMSNNDIWIHLKTGEVILNTWEVPHKDPYSFTAPDRDYVAHEWLSGVVFYLVYAASGVNGLIFFKSAVIFATCAALYVACMFRKDRLVVLFPCFTVMMLIGSARFLERPHIFSYLFAALYLMCYFAYREGGRRRGWLYAIPVLHILWTNLHGGHYQGIFLLIMLATAEVVMYQRGTVLGLARQEALPRRDVVLICALPFLSLAAGLINPYGYRLLTFPFELTGQEIFMKGIYEWQPAIFPSYNISSMFLTYIVWIAVLFGSFLLVGNHTELRGLAKDAAGMLNFLLGLAWLFFVYQFAAVYKSQGPTTFEKLTPLWYALIALFLVANFHRLKFHHAGIVALFFAISMKHNRGVTDAAIATLPTLSANLNALLDRLRERIAATRDWLKPAALFVMAIGMFGLGLFTFLDSYYFSFNPATKRDMGLGIAGNMPVSAVDYIARNHITGNAFTSYNSAAMLINRMWPEVKVSMDSRNDVYGEALYREYRDTLASPSGPGPYLEKWPIDFILMTLGSDIHPQFFRFLDASPDWALVYFDDRFAVYLKNIPRFREVILRDAFRSIKPAQSGGTPITREIAPAWLAEAERAAAAAPGAWTPMHYKTKALLALDRLDEAETAARETLALNPDAFFAWADLGYIYAQRGQAGLAEDAYRRCAAINPSFPPCKQAMTISGGAR